MNDNIDEMRTIVSILNYINQPMGSLHLNAPDDIAFLVREIEVYQKLCQDAAGCTGQE